jgi:hypothetical protein
MPERRPLCPFAPSGRALFAPSKQLSAAPSGFSLFSSADIGLREAVQIFRIEILPASVHRDVGSQREQ